MLIIRSLLILIFQSPAFALTDVALTCVEKLSPWACKLSTGKMIDLKPLGTGKVPAMEGVYTGSNYFYQWDPVRTFDCGSEHIGTVSACQTDKSQLHFDIGDQSSSAFKTDSVLGLTITYSSKSSDGTREATVVLVCDQTKEKDYVVIGEVPTGSGKFQMKLTSKYACPVEYHPSAGGGGSGISVGTILIIILLVSLTLYFAVGISINIFARHRSGPEAIPNRETWVMMFGLVKDGATFTVNKIRRQDSYQKM